ncbi:MAG: hypothetical protein AAB635_01830 [Patescibacteria group bacterium]
MGEKHIKLIADRIALFIGRRITLCLIALVIIVTAVLAFLPFDNPEVKFNQNYIESVDREFDSRSFRDTFKVALSNYTARLNSFFGNGSVSEVDLANIDSVFAYVWSNIPYYAIVYPTEMYYYYRIPGANLSGNLRFSDIGNGKLSFAFFSTDNARSFDSGNDYKLFDEKDGLLIGAIENNRVRITYKGKSVIFELPHIQYDRPKNLKILPEEEIISKIRDESGIVFYLFFNDKTNFFYYVLDEESPVTEVLTKADGNIYLGERTQFAYYDDKNFARKILVGVSTENIWENNYFDGPFDQVPPNLEIREKLYKAYPYTQYMNGLDPNGNFLDWKGSRVAISSYLDYYYPDITELQKRINGCKTDLEPSAFWSCLTYETKKDFHKTIPEFFFPDGRKK